MKAKLHASIHTTVTASILTKYNYSEMRREKTFAQLLLWQTLFDTKIIFSVDK